MGVIALGCGGAGGSLVGGRGGCVVVHTIPQHFERIIAFTSEQFRVWMWGRKGYIGGKRIAKEDLKPVTTNALDGNIGCM